MNYREVIRLRYSTRTFSNTMIDTTTIHNIQEMIKQPIETPFKNYPSFFIVNLTDLSEDEFKKYGTYGRIKNAKFFIVGSIKLTKEGLIDYGYSIENIVLKLTDMSFKTCWLGGNFNKSRFETSISLRNEEVIPAIIASGYCDVLLSK